MINLRKLDFVIISLFLIMLATSTKGQTKTITGKVFDALSSKAMPGIKVKLLALKKIAVCDFKGEYSFTVPDSLKNIEFEIVNGMEIVEIKKIDSDTYDIYLSDVEFSDLTLEELLNVKVTGVSRYKQSAEQTPNSVIVITKQQIESRGYQDLSDVLKDIPGFDISDKRSTLWRILLRLEEYRGMNEFLVLYSMGTNLIHPLGLCFQSEILYRFDLPSRLR